MKCLPNDPVKLTLARQVVLRGTLFLQAGQRSLAAAFGCPCGELYQHGGGSEAMRIDHQLNDNQASMVPAAPQDLPSQHGLQAARQHHRPSWIRVMYIRTHTRGSRDSKKDRISSISGDSSLFPARPRLAIE